MKLLIFSFSILALTTIASAALVTIDPGTGTTTTFTATGSHYNSPSPVFINNFFISGDVAVSYGDDLYGLGINKNGAWSPDAPSSFPWVGTNGSTNYIQFSLGGTYGVVGGFMNYVINSGGNNATIQAIASNGITILESDNLITAPGGAISTPNATNGGAFRGISRAQNDIAFFRVSGDYIILHSLEIGAAGIAGTATPEPATALTGGLALAGLVLLRRLRTRA